MDKGSWRTCEPLTRDIIMQLVVLLPAAGYIVYDELFTTDDIEEFPYIGTFDFLQLDRYGAFTDTISTLYTNASLIARLKYDVENELKGDTLGNSSGGVD